MNEAGFAASELLTRAAAVAREDDASARTSRVRRFSQGSRPVIRWIKGNGRDDVVTRAAIAQATRLFGDRVDYCLCTQGIDAVRARWILAWAVQPVEWWPVTAADNPALAAHLTASGCAEENFGYWWKWFPERVRPDGPEWILDGDMVVTAMPPWFDIWAEGLDRIRVAQDDHYPIDMLYGRYRDLADDQLCLYSGLISLPPRLTYMSAVDDVLALRPLARPHNGTIDMCEQGVIAAAFAVLGAVPIPLEEFPFGRSFQPALDFGGRGDQGRHWGYHFGCSFRGPNRHFEALSAAGTVYSQAEQPDDTLRFAWLGGQSQWGTPGWSMPEAASAFILDHARRLAGRRLLELGTSRGRMTAVLASSGFHVTTIDRHDRGAAQNLDALAVRVVIDDALHFLATTTERFDAVVVDLHGNSVAEWMRLGPLLARVLRADGSLIISNAALWQIEEWRQERGVLWFLDSLGPEWRHVVHEQPVPGIALATRPHAWQPTVQTDDPGVHLIVDGLDVWPLSQTGGVYVFRAVCFTGAIQIRSRHAVPNQCSLPTSDDRRLGVALVRLRITAPGLELVLGPDWAGFGEGFHSSEGTHRWTDGDGRLVALAYPGMPNTVTIELTSFVLPFYPWNAPAPLVLA